MLVLAETFSVQSEDAESHHHVIVRKLWPQCLHRQVDEQPQSVEASISHLCREATPSSKRFGVASGVNEGSLPSQERHHLQCVPWIHHSPIDEQIFQPVDEDGDLLRDACHIIGLGVEESDQLHTFISAFAEHAEQQAPLLIQEVQECQRIGCAIITLALDRYPLRCLDHTVQKQACSSQGFRKGSKSILLGPEVLDSGAIHWRFLLRAELPKDITECWRVLNPLGDWRWGQDDLVHDLVQHFISCPWSLQDSAGNLKTR